jgi:hypothetical protein
LLASWAIDWRSAVAAWFISATLARMAARSPTVAPFLQQHHPVGKYFASSLRLAGSSQVVEDLGRVRPHYRHEFEDRVSVLGELLREDHASPLGQSYVADLLEHWHEFCKVSDV